MRFPIQVLIPDAEDQMIRSIKKTKNYQAGECLQGMKYLQFRYQSL